MKNRLLRFFMEEKAQGLTEYSLIIALAVIVVIASITLVGNNLISNYLISATRITTP